MLSLSSIPSAAKFCNPSSIPVTRLAPPPLLCLRRCLRPGNSLLPTLSLSTGGLPSSHASTICRQSSPSLPQRTSLFGIDGATDSLVQIFSTTPKTLQPWDKSDRKEEMGSGFIISGRRILAHDHTVNNYSSFRVRKFGSPTFYTAKVESAVYDYGLATLVVDCDEFWEHTHPLELHDDLPSIGETVTVLAYDHNTIELIDGAITSSDPPRDYQYGTLSIQFNKDSCSSRSGPIFLGNKIIGFYAGFGYETIPASVIKSFLDGLEERQTSFDDIDIWYQTMEDAQLRKHFKMSHDMTGVLIIDFVPLSNASKVLKLYDVILGIEGFPVDNDGTIRHFQKKELFSIDHLISMKKPGETALVRILRDGKEHVFNVSLNFTELPPLVPYKFIPSYYIVAGFVFVPLSKPYVDKSSVICKCALKSEAKTDGEQIVIISQVLSDDINEDYPFFHDFEVKKVNGVEVVNLKHLSELVENCSIEDLRFDLRGGYVIVLNNKEAKEATSLILERNGIPSAKSNDLQ